MMMKDSLFLQISNVLGRGPSNIDEGISVSADFNVLRRGPLMNMKDSLFLQIYNV